MNIIERLSAGVLARQSWVVRVLARAPYAYKVYYIPKKSGGMREIAQPAKETKRLQYWAMDNILSNFSVHSAAFAYVKGKNIKQNAAIHVKNQYLAKFDVRDFFPSIKSEHVIRFFSENSDLSEGDIKLLSRLFLRKKEGEDGLCMSIGAPSSPMLSNILLFKFDQAVSEKAKGMGVRYSRYADDMTFSTNKKAVLFQIADILREEFQGYPYGEFVLNEEKTIFRSKRNSRRVTGLVISNEETVSLGRERKRLLRSMIHYYSIGKLNQEESCKLQGLLSFAQDVEPDFIDRMRSKYGISLINQIITLAST